MELSFFYSSRYEKVAKYEDRLANVPVLLTNNETMVRGSKPMGVDVK